MGKKITQLPALPDGYSLNDDTLLAVVVGDGTEDRPFKTIKIDLATLRGLVGGGGSTLPPSLIDLGYMEEVWRFNTPGGEPVYSSPIGPVTVHDGTNFRDAVIFVSWDWHCYAVDVNTGEEIWRKAAGSNCYGRPQAKDVDGNGDVTIFFPSHDGSVWAVNNVGGTRWRFFNVYDREGTGTATAAGTYYLEDSTKAWAVGAFIRGTQGQNASIEITSGTGVGQIREISQNNEGNRLWIFDAWETIPDATSTYRIVPKYESDRIFMHAGTLGNDNYLYVTGFDNHVYRINAATGELDWKFATGENIEPYPLVYIDGVYVVSIDGKLRRLHRYTGELEWEAATGQCDAFLTANVWDGVLFVSSRNNCVYTVSMEDGTILSVSEDTGGDIDSSATPVYLEGAGVTLVVSGSDGGAVWGFDVNTMETLWSYPAPGQFGINSSPIFHDVNNSGSSNALIGDMGGNLFCINLEDGSPIGCLTHAGGIEGVPLYADIDGDGRVELVVTTLAGEAVCYRFLSGSPSSSYDWPGLYRWMGYQNDLV